MIKWTEKNVMEHAVDKKSPFEEVNGNGNLPDLARKIEEIAMKNRGVKP